MLRHWFSMVASAAAVGVCFSAATVARRLAPMAGPQPRRHLHGDRPAQIVAAEGGPPRVWMFEECGDGYGGPAIVGGRVFIMGVRDDEEVLLALDAATGDEQWMAPIGEVYEEGHGDGPRSTPTVDGELVYALGAMGDLICANVDSGDVVWTKSMEDLGGKRPHWGYSESPLVYQGHGPVHARRRRRVDRRTGQEHRRLGLAVQGNRPATPTTRRSFP